MARVTGVESKSMTFFDKSDIMNTFKAEKYKSTMQRQSKDGKLRLCTRGEIYRGTNPSIRLRDSSSSRRRRSDFFRS